MIDARFVPVERWLGEKTKRWARKDAAFRTPYAKTLMLLDRELSHLNAKRIVVQAYFRQDQIRNDGWPRSSALPSEPGVIVSFASNSGDLSYPCDRFKTYEDNIRAIALSLEALRSVDRYGVTRNSEQYKGWAKLPPAPAKMTVREAIAFIVLHTSIEPTSPDKLREAYRAAARKLHPDVSGTDQQFIFLGKAKDAIEEAYGWGAKETAS